MPMLQIFQTAPFRTGSTRLFPKKDTKIAESLTLESTALQSHLLWITNLLMALTKKIGTNQCHQDHPTYFDQSPASPEIGAGSSHR